jgi:hypothetical protein
MRASPLFLDKQLVKRLREGGIETKDCRIMENAAENAEILPKKGELFFIQYFLYNIRRILVCKGGVTYVNNDGESG